MKPRTSPATLLLLLAVAAAPTLASCGDEESEEKSTTTAQDGCPIPDGSDQCYADCVVNGIQGRVTVPSCTDAAFFADVVLLDELGAEIATTEASAQGEFTFTPPSDGTYIIRASRGVFQTTSPQPFSVTDGASPFQVVIVQ